MNPIVLGAGSHQAGKRLGRITAILAVLLLSCAATSLAQPGSPGCGGLVRADLEAERRCRCSEDVRDRKRHLKTILTVQKSMDIIGCEEVRPVDDLCGEFDDITTTYIKISGCEETLDVGDNCELTAEIHGLGCSDSGPGCRCEDPLVEVELGGNVVWITQDPLTAEVDPDSGRVTGITAGIVDIEAISPDWPEIRGSTSVQVGGGSADIIFVVSNGMDNYGRFPPGGWFPPSPGEYYDAAAFNFDDFDLSLVAFNSNRCTDTTFCGIPSEDCYTDRTVIPLGSDELSRADWQAGWDSISVVCDYPDTPGSGEMDLGSGQFSALMHAITNSQWDYTKDVRAIFLLPAEPACFWQSSGYCDTEPGSGISIDTVIEAALDADVKIFSINWNAGMEWSGGGAYCKYHPTSRWVFLKEELVRLSAGTGGFYYDSEGWFDCVVYPEVEDVIWDAMLLLSLMITSEE